jgi:hypothetical protein
MKTPFLFKQERAREREREREREIGFVCGVPSGQLDKPDGLQEETSEGERDRYRERERERERKSKP